MNIKTKNAIKKTWMGRFICGIRQSRAGRRFLLSRFPRNSVGMEIGVHLGDFSAEILKVVKPTKLFLVDPWKYAGDDELYRDAWYGAKSSAEEMENRYQGVLSRFEKEREEKTVEVLRGISQDIALQFADGSLDWAYIDGNHLYDFVKNDLQICSKMVKSGGLITGDDYEERGWWDHGVRRAVDEFVAGGQASLILIRNNQFILRNR